jgi:hypothetical protein
MVTDEIEEQLGRSPEDWFHRGIGKPFLPSGRDRPRTQNQSF